MIFVRDKGRMCNNILQYGHLYAWGREHGRSTISMRFAYKYPYFLICHTRWHNFMTYVIAKYAAKCGLIPVVKFNEEHAITTAQEDAMLRHKWIVAEGWYARWYNLFLKYKSEIITLFTFNEEIEQKITSTYLSDDSILRLGVHIRRGDYATFKGGRFFYTDDQYAVLISQFFRLHPEKRIYVYICTNDPNIDTARYNNQFGENVFFPRGNQAEDLCLLSHCDYLIGAPSTYSLVAAMYHDTPLYWIMDAETPLHGSSFRSFNDLFKHII